MFLFSFYCYSELYKRVVQQLIYDIIHTHTDTHTCPTHVTAEVLVLTLCFITLPVCHYYYNVHDNTHNSTTGI